MVMLTEDIKGKSLALTSLFFFPTNVAVQDLTLFVNGIVSLRITTSPNQFTLLAILDCGSVVKPVA